VEVRIYVKLAGNLLAHKFHLLLLGSLLSYGCGGAWWRKWERLNHGGVLGLHSKPYRLPCIRGICSRAYTPGHMPLVICSRAYAPGHVLQGICSWACAPGHMLLSLMMKKVVAVETKELFQGLPLDTVLNQSDLPPNLTVSSPNIHLKLVLQSLPLSTSKWPFYGGYHTKILYGISALPALLFCVFPHNTYLTILATIFT
jgi:hypothetical protein